jgi:hypothetical protein
VTNLGALAPVNPARERERREAMSNTQTADSNSASVTPAIGLLGPQDIDGLMLSGTFEVWTTRNGLPVAELVRADGSKAYRTTAHNAMTNAMLDLVRNVLWRLGTNASGPAGGLWTAGPYIGLSTGSISATSTLASGLNEAVGNGYGRVAPTWAAGGTGQGNNTASAAAYTASGGTLGGAALAQLFTTAAASGTGSAPNNVLMTFATLSGGPYTVASGNTLNVTYTHTLS